MAHTPPYKLALHRARYESSVTRQFPRDSLMVMSTWMLAPAAWQRSTFQPSRLILHPATEKRSRVFYWPNIISEPFELRIGALGDSLKGKLFQAMYKGTVAPEIGGP